MKPTVLEIGMNKMSRIFRLLTLIAAFLGSSIAMALPIGWTEITVDGANVLVDTSGDQWLSPFYTEGLSINDALATSYGTTHGFEVATVNQFNALLTAFLLPTSTDTNGNDWIEWPIDYNSAVGNEVNHFMVEFNSTTGIYSHPGHSRSDNLGFLFESSLNSTINGGYVRYDNFSGDDYGGVGSAQAPFASTTQDDAYEYWGTWLYRSPTEVPEPPAIVLFGIGLLLLILTRRPPLQREYV